GLGAPAAGQVDDEGDFGGGVLGVVVRPGLGASGELLGTAVQRQAVGGQDVPQPGGGDGLPALPVLDGGGREPAGGQQVEDQQDVTQGSHGSRFLCGPGT